MNKGSSENRNTLNSARTIVRRNGRIINLVIESSLD